MSSSRLRVCLLAGHHACYVPRLVREADTLAARGHDVRVVAPSFDDRLAAWDEEAATRGGWRLQHFDYRRGRQGRMRSILVRGRRRLEEGVWKVAPLSGAGFRSLLAGYGGLSRLARCEPSDWLIAHSHHTLPIAAAAVRRGSRLGFDCEDLLEFMGSADPRLIRRIESTFIPRCDYVSVTSHAMGEHLAGLHPIRRWIVLYNTQQLKFAEGLLPPERRPPGSPLKLFWVSKTIGPGVGLEPVAEAMRLLPDDVELHLYGSARSGYLDRLRSAAGSAGERIHVGGLVAPEAILPTASAHDIGLAPYPTDNLNSRLTTSNKLFSSLLAGLAVIATDGPGNREVASQAGDAIVLFPSGDAGTLARTIDAFRRDRGALLHARGAAWQVARSRFCWEREEGKLLGAVEEGR